MRAAPACMVRLNLEQVSSQDEKGTSALEEALDDDDIQLPRTSLEGRTSNPQLECAREVVCASSTTRPWVEPGMPTIGVRSTKAGRDDSATGGQESKGWV